MSEYKIKSAPRAKKIRITIYRDGRVSVTKPKWVSKKSAEAFVATKIDWINSQVEIGKNNPQNILSKYGRKEFTENKEGVRVLVHKKLEEFNKFYNFEYKGVSIRNQRTRWGSCSSKKNLSFNFKIIYLPVELQNYLIVHELCHLKEMNHSQRFWDLVGKTILDYRSLSKKIRSGNI